MQFDSMALTLILPLLGALVTGILGTRWGRGISGGSVGPPSAPVRLSAGPAPVRVTQRREDTKGSVGLGSSITHPTVHIPAK